MSGVIGGTSGDCSGGKAIMTGIKVFLCMFFSLPGSTNSGVRTAEGACVGRECQTPYLGGWGRYIPSRKRDGVQGSVPQRNESICSCYYIPWYFPKFCLS